MIIDDEWHEPYFVHIRKTGGTSIKEWLNRNNIICKRWRHFTLQEMVDHLYPSEKQWSFCVVRNTFDRMQSWYWHDLILMGSHHSFITFEKWIVRFQDYWIIQSHVLPQRRYSDPCDVVLRFENLQEDFQQIQEAFKCYDPLPVENVGKYEFDVYEDGRNVDLVNEIMADEIEYYGHKL